MSASRMAGRLPLIHALVVAIWVAITSTTVWSATATIIPDQDNTVAQELPDNSSGACDSIFSGLTDNGIGTARRALLQFDIAAAIPPGSIITSVTLNMAVTRGGNHTDTTFDLHRVTKAWGEGANTCGVRGGGQGEPALTGSVTWNSAMHQGNPAWDAPGGDFSPVPSGSTLINDTTPVWPSTAAMVADVQDWLDNPVNNYGWILIGDEINKTTTRRFDSREGAIAPKLVVEFDLDPNTPVEACCQDGSCSLTAVGSGTCTGTTEPIASCDPNPCPQPTGACCNADNTCSDIDRLTCEGGGGEFVGGNCNQADCGLAPFVEALPIPPVLQPTGTRADGVPQYTISVEAASQSVHPGLPATDLWTYNGAWPSFTILASKDQPIEVTYQNNLPTGGGGRGNNLLEVDTCSHGPNYWGDSKRIVTHLHGGHLPSRFDGQPEYTLLPGESDIYEYPNNQDAGTLWYHDHALGITRLNVYGGMAGFYLLADSEDTLDATNAFGLPSGPYEIGLAIQDRSFNTDGSLFYNAQLEDAFKGDYAVVNGKISPYLNVDQGKYRFRILNGSQSREYDLRLENITDPGNDPSFTLVGTDLGLVSAPIDLGNSFGTMAPAERMDVVIDFAGYPAGTEIILRNDELTPPLLPSIMKFIVTGNPGYTGTTASTLREVTPMSEASADVTRYFRLKKHPNADCKDGSGRLVNEWLVESLDGPNGNVKGQYWDDLSDFPILGNREVWVFENPTNSMHPMHVHLVRFQILSKTDLNTGQPIPLEKWEENTWKDIVRIPANTRARIIMDFEDYLGRFPQHCHLLDHEDHEMMRQYQTTFGYCNSNGTCDPGEDCVSCANDCAQVSGARCGNGLCEGGDGENCLTCRADCAGKQVGSTQNQFCCGATGGTGNIGCGLDVNDNRCIDASASRFCRIAPRVSACCGDRLCEGAETITSCTNDCDPSACVPTEPGIEYSCSDGLDNDCDGLIDNAEPNNPNSDCADNDSDGLPNGVETETGIYLDPTHTGTDPGVSDTDGDGLGDGEEVSIYETDPTKSDSDGDLLPDGLEVANGSNPNDPASFPHFETCDVAPVGSAPDGETNAGDLTVAIQLALGLRETRSKELAYCDMSPYDDVINARDISLLIQMLLAP